MAILRRTCRWLQSLAESYADWVLEAHGLNPDQAPDRFGARQPRHLI